jgi:hypothetical protein
VDRPLPWLRYLDADEIENDDVDFDGLKVESASAEDLGTVDGFIIDSVSARPYYLVVKSSGWFKSKHFLIPAGHARLDTAGERVVADRLTRDQVSRFPGFNVDEFDKLQPQDVKRMNDDICAACNLTTVTYSASEPYSAAWSRAEYRYPDWWQSAPFTPDQVGGAASTPGARGLTSNQRSAPASSQAWTPAAAEPSPHFDGRAQPGDVLGLETGGERTYVGDTADDENTRRKDAEQAGRKLDD